MISIETLQPFSYLFNSDLQNQIAAVSQLRYFKKGEIIIDIDEDLNHIPLLLKGNIKILREDDKGNELLLYVLENGDTCAMSLTCSLSKSKSKIRAIADEDVDVILIPMSHMKTWVDTDESWRNFILQSYQTRFDEMLEIIDTLAFMNMDERLHKYLTDHVKLSSSTILDITHQNIAEDLNTSRVVISRLLKQLENKGQIKLGRHKIEVLYI